MKGRKEDLNIKGAFLHMAADAGVSFGVVIAGLLIMIFGWLWIDPAISIVIVLVIVFGTWGLLKESFQLSMDAVPKGIELKQVENFLRTLSGVKEVHDLHIWAMSTTENALTVHLVIPDDNKDDFFLKKICGELHSRFGIEHSTIQIEKSAQAANCDHNKI
jgi:cobalt-zinc-cadmium efflux system protein